MSFLVELIDINQETFNKKHKVRISKIFKYKLNLTGNI
jgi:hypothetical protein